MSNKLIDNKKLMKEWNWEKNLIYVPNELSLGSSKKVWWKCNKGHEWEAVIHTRSKGVGCPYCMGKKAIKGINDFATIYPDMLKEWDYEKNEKVGIKPDAITKGSQKNIWWKCNKGHSYSRTITDRFRNMNCPYCSNRKVLKGFNDLVTTNPELLKEWNYDKNNALGISPESITNGGKNKVWWKCDKGHEWDSIIRSRIKGSGCPYCANKKILKGYNDLATTNPELLNYWYFKENDKLGITPYNISHGSHKKVWWICPNKKEHIFEASINNRIKGADCPYCSNRKILEGFNDFETLHPKLMKEWNYEKNDKLGINPKEFIHDANKIVWWKCDKGHQWKAPIKNRIKKIGLYAKCPFCSNFLKISFPEKLIFFYIKKYFEDALDNYRPKWMENKELDIYIPSIKTAIEYDGSYYHKDKNRDILKDQLCQKNNIILIRIREKNTPNIKTSSIVYRIERNNQVDQKHLEGVFNFLSDFFKIKIDFNIERDIEEIYDLYIQSDLENSLEINNPELLKEWDYDKNNRLNITPKNVYPQSSIKVWWKCEKGHSYRAMVSNKYKGSSCPICCNKKVLKGYNDLATTNPELLKYWDYDKNLIKPTEITRNSTKNIWWKCKKGHSWDCKLNNKSDDEDCPYCSNHRILKGYNDITTTNLEILKEWDYEENKKESISPYNYSKGSNKLVNWKCNKGHKYKSRISDKIYKKSGCPFCSNERLLEGYNDLATTNPEILKEWNYEKNDKLELYPNHFFAGSTKKVWWICEKNHSYEATIVNKVIQGTNCPYCSSNKILFGFNDISTTMPQALKIWNYEKNDKLKIYPTNISKNSGKKIWWYCNKCDNEWEAIVANMNKVDFECPVCRKQRIHNNHIKQKQKEYEKKLLLKTNMLLVINYNGIKEIAEYKCLNCNKTFSKRADVILYNPKCPYCKK